jgi:PAS domain S-box-containing protein
MSQFTDVIKTITDETPNIIMIKNYDGKFAFANQTLATLYNTTPENMVGKSDSDFNPNKEQTDFYLKNIQDIMDSNQLQIVYEESTDVATNQNRHYQSLKKPFIDSNGKKNILVLANDITDIHNERVKIEEKETMLNLALEIIGEGVWDWDLSTNMVKHNQQWCDMFYVDDSKLEHDLEFFSSVLHPDDAKGVFEKIQKTLQTNQNYISQHRIICTDGTIKWVEDRGRVIKFDGDNNPLRMIGCVKDITDTVNLKAKELLLEKQSRLATLGEMIGNIAHQWRQPLSMITTMASTVSVYNSMKSLDEKIIDESMDGIIKQAEYLSDTITDFRNFIKNDRDKQNFHISSMIQKCLSIANASLSKYYIQIVLNGDDDALCNGFESEILQALLNILNNAKDVLVEKVEDELSRFIFIETKINDNTIEITIKDNAGGIPENILDKVFDPYFTTKNDTDGTGLGLHMSKQIIEDSFGKLTVSNQVFSYQEIEHKGAMFTLTFPIIEEMFS